MGKRKASKGGATRTTISVPAELKKRMDRVKEDINWSALACQAFEVKLAELDSRKEVRKMGEVIDRLRASKVKAESDAFQAGYQAGQEWAKQSAEVTELRRLREIYDQPDPMGGMEWLLTEGISAYAAYERLFFAMHPREDGDRDAASNFWESVLGSDSQYDLLNDDDWLRGFSDGASDVWDSVKDQL